MFFNGFYYSDKQLSENKRTWKDKQILGSYQRSEKAVEHKNNSDTSYSWCPWNIPKVLEKRLGEMNGR